MSWQNYPERNQDQANSTIAVAICNRALTRVGMNGISALGQADPDSEEALRCNDLYWDIAREILCLAPFRNAMTQQRLSYTGRGMLAKYPYLFAFPNNPDPLQIEQVIIPIDGSLPRGHQVPFDVYDSGIASDVDPDAGPVCEYVYRADETLWTPMMRRAVADMLTGELFGSINDDVNMEKWIRRAESYTTRIASQKSARARTPVRIPPGRINVSRGAKRGTGGQYI